MYYVINFTREIFYSSLRVSLKPVVMENEVPQEVRALYSPERLLNFHHRGRAS